MYLIDTSVWIDFFRKKNNKGTKEFDTILEQNLTYGITSIIYQEILQGAATPTDFTMLDQYLSSQRFYYPKDPIRSYSAAALIYFSCRKKGITPRSTFDCLIAQVALENNLILIHNDRDFEAIKKIYPKLKLLS